MSTAQKTKEKLFKEAEVEEAKLKIGIYGEAGSGKTFTALQLATGLGKNIAMIDTEYNASIYANDFEFAVMETRSLKKVIDVLKSNELEQYDVLIIDSITHLWEDAQNSFLEALKKSKNPAKRQRAYEGDIQFQDWKKIKTPYKQMIGMMLAIDKHVIFTGRLSYNYEYKKGELTTAGVKMDAERGTPYEPTILIRMENNNGSNVAFVEKDRTNTIQGQRYENPGFEMLANAMKKLGKSHKVRPPAEEAYSEDLFAEDDIENKPTTEKTFADLPKPDKAKIKKFITPLLEKLAADNNITPDNVLKQSVQQLFGKKSINELTVDECRTLHSKLKDKIH